MLCLLRTHLNEAYIASVSFTKSARAVTCCPEFYFFKKISSDFAFLIWQGTNSDVFGAREDTVYILKYTVRFFAFAELNYFSNCMISVQSEKYLSEFQALNYFPPVAKIGRFLW